MSELHLKKVFQLSGHKAAVYALAPGPESGTFFSAGGDGWIVRWSLTDRDENGELLGRLVAKVDAQVFSLAFIPTTQTIVAGDMNGGVHWINLQEDRPNRHLSHHKKGTFNLLLAADDLISLGGDGVLTRWDALRQKSIESLRLSSQSLRSVIYLEEEQDFLIGASDNNIYRVSAIDLSLKETVRAAHDNSVFTLCRFQGHTVFSGGRDAQLKQWRNTETLQLTQAQPAHWYTINDLETVPGSDYLLSASRDKTIRIWNAAEFKLLKTLDAARDGGHINSVNRLLWLEGTQQFVSASDDRSIIVWELEHR